MNIIDIIIDLAVIIVTILAIAALIQAGIEHDKEVIEKLKERDSDS